MSKISWAGHSLADARREFTRHRCSTIFDATPSIHWSSLSRRSTPDGIHGRQLAVFRSTEADVSQSVARSPTMRSTHLDETDRSETPHMCLDRESVRSNGRLPYRVRSFDGEEAEPCVLDVPITELIDVCRGRPHRCGHSFSFHLGKRARPWCQHESSGPRLLDGRINAGGPSVVRARSGPSSF